MKSIIKGAGYILVHTPDMVIHNGTTQTTERVVNPESEYLKELPEHIRSFEDTLSYYPNQVYIGNVTPDALAAVPQPWHDKKCPETSRFGQFGQMSKAPGHDIAAAHKIAVLALVGTKDGGDGFAHRGLF